METKIALFPNSVDSDEMTYIEPPHLDLHCLPSSLRISVMACSAGINYPPYCHENLLLSGELSRWCWYGGLLNIVLKCTTTGCQK